MEFWRVDEARMRTQAKGNHEEDDYEDEDFGARKEGPSSNSNNKGLFFFFFGFFLIISVMWVCVDPSEKDHIFRFI